MRLAVLDSHGSVILSWPTTRDAHRDLGEHLAAKVHPRFYQGAKRRRLARQLVAHILDLQAETRAL